MAVTLPISGKTVYLRLLTLGDEVEAFEYGRKTGSNYLYTFAQSIVDKDVDIVAQTIIVGDLHPADLEEIRKFHKKYDHGPDRKVPYTCPLCGYEGKIVLPFQLSGLFSFSEKS